jgi:hypothetical protein
MKVDVHDRHTNITLTTEEMKHLCTPGKGADTCIWLILGSEGFECSCLHRHPSLITRWKEGKTVAKRDGCDFVNTIDPSELNLGEQIVEVPGITYKTT